MPAYQAIAWLPLCGGLTGVGLVLSWFAWRRRGAAAGLRGVAWSLLPIAAYLTGVVKLIWTFVTAIANFAWSSVFSFQGWAGIIVAGVAVVLFGVSGGMRRWRARKQGAQAPSAATTGTAPSKEVAKAPAPARALAGKKRSAAADDEFSDVAAILKRRGIS
ncbi:MAG TPA: cellulose synthase [Streptosporangiaceae bacterium]|nr:cellulose synthase [Streptosporangiaceae bacterium]